MKQMKSINEIRAFYSFWTEEATFFSLILLNRFLPYLAFVDIDGFSSKKIGGEGYVRLDTTLQTLRFGAKLSRLLPSENAAFASCSKVVLERS